MYIKNVCNITLCINDALYNNQICPPVPYDPTPDHYAPSPKSVPLNNATIGDSHCYACIPVIIRQHD